MKLQRLLALSSTAVIAAACSGGGSSVAPHATAAGSGSTATKHAANAKLSLTFPTNVVHLKKAAKSAGATARNPAFLDPGGNEDYVDLIDVRVDNYGSSTFNSGVTTSYMASTASSFTPGENATIPIYLAPGNDLITVQEYELPSGGYMLSAPGANSSQGYLLAQGQANVSVSEGTLNSPSVTMQMVLGSYLENIVATTDGNYSTAASGIAIITDSSYDSVGVEGSVGYFSPTLSSAQNSPMCVASGATLYFLPVDDAYAVENPFTGANGAGNINVTQGLPVIAVSASAASGSSSLTQSPLGYYVPSFDANYDQINVQATFPNGLLVDPTPFGPFTGLAAGTGVTSIANYSNYAYYVTLASENSTYCQGVAEETSAHVRRIPGASDHRKPSPRT